MLDYQYNNPIDIFQQPDISSQLSAIRDEYLSTIQTMTLLEYLEEKLTTTGYRLSELMRTRFFPLGTMNILPMGMQFKEIRITNEYVEIAEELKHKVRFIASRQDTVDSRQGDLFDITIDTCPFHSHSL